MSDAAPRMEPQPRKTHFLDGLYRAHYRSLVTHARRKFGPGPPEPEELVQAAFARLASAGDIERIPNAEAYLKLTMRNLAIDASRRRDTQEAFNHDLVIAQENNHESSAEDVYSSKQELERLANIVADLKPKQRAAFLMHRIDGLSYADISRQMNISESGARLLVNEAFAICVKRMGTR